MYDLQTIKEMNEKRAKEREQREQREKKFAPKYIIEVEFTNGSTKRFDADGFNGSGNDYSLFRHVYYKDRPNEVAMSEYPIQIPKANVLIIQQYERIGELQHVHSTL